MENNVKSESPRGRSKARARVRGYAHGRIEGEGGARYVGTLEAEIGPSGTALTSIGPFDLMATQIQTLLPNLGSQAKEAAQ